ncbi:MAG TPA: PAS domain-containing protein [Sedimentisphaerales bacterium]|nr:PAS domain-containing protein [Sedimentisphaerales bacterium]
MNEGIDNFKDATNHERQLRAANVQLNAANQQLKATMQQLGAANQQLRATEDKLRESLQRVKTLFEGSINAIAVYKIADNGNDMVVRDLNPSAEQLENVKKEHCVGKSVLQLFPDIKKFGLFDVFLRVWKSGQPELYLETRHKDGKVFGWRRNYVFRLPGDEAAVIYEDITERKRAEEARQEEHNLLLTLINSLPDPIYVKDEKSRFVICNTAVGHIMGVAAPEELSGRTDFDFYPEQLAHKYYTDEQTVIKSGRALIGRQEPVENQTTGETRLSLTTKVPWLDSQGTIVGIIGIGRDITQLKQIEEQLRAANKQLAAEEQQLKAANQQLKATEQQLKAANQQLAAEHQQLTAASQQLKATEQQLKAANQQLTAEEQQLRAINQQLKATERELLVSRQLYQTIFEGSISAVAVYKAVDNGRDFILDNINPSGQRLEKVKKEDAVGKSLSGIFAKAKETGLQDVFERVWRTGKAEHCPVSVYEQGRISSWRQNYVYKLPSGEIVLLYQDITERKQVEQKLLDYQAQLKSLASQLSLAEERERRHIAIELHDRISQSLVISKVKLDALCESVFSRETAGHLKEIRNLLDQTIQNTRSLTFDLSSPILYELGFEAAVAEWLTEQVQEKHGIAAEFEDDDQPKPMDESVRILLFRDVRELLINVIKHAHARKVKVSVCKQGEKVCVTVEDNGVGFDPGRIATMPTKTGGFGLFSIRERLEQVGGQLVVESRSGGGSRVTMTVPIKPENKISEANQ